MLRLTLQIIANNNQNIGGSLGLIAYSGGD